MADASELKPWSNNPYAPQIPYSLYFAEKTNFAGVLIGAIFYGIVIVLFFQCMGALLTAPCHKGGTKWGLVAHAVSMFTFVTIYTGMTLNIQSISFIDNRNFPGADGVLPPGPVGYQFLIYSKAISIVPNVAFLLNNWLADGLLLYRCYIIYNMNYWVIAFPCLMYLASLSMGILLVYQTSQPSGIWNSLAANVGIPYFSISVSLNVLLTLMIVARLILHDRNLKSAMGGPDRVGGLYKTIVTMLIESCALYALTSLLFIGPWYAKNHASDIFLPILAEVQVIAPFLIIIRAANRPADTSMTSNLSGTAGDVRIGSHGTSKNGGRALPVGYSMNSMDSYGKTSGQLSVGVETSVDLHHDKV